MANKLKFCSEEKRKDQKILALCVDVKNVCILLHVCWFDVVICNPIKLELETRTTEKVRQAVRLARRHCGCDACGSRPPGRDGTVTPKQIQTYTWELSYPVYIASCSALKSIAQVEFGHEGENHYHVVKEQVLCSGVEDGISGGRQAHEGVALTAAISEGMGGLWPLRGLSVSKLSYLWI